MCRGTTLLHRRLYTAFPLPFPAAGLIKSCNVLSHVAAYSALILVKSFRCEARGCIHGMTISCASHHPAAFCFHSHLLLVPVNACLICSIS